MCVCVRVSKMRKYKKDVPTEYKLKNSFFNYSKFVKRGAEFVDTKGRWYIQLNNELDSKVLEGFHTEFKGHTLFYVAVPIHLRGEADLPDAEGETLTLYNIQDQTLFVTSTNGVYFDGHPKQRKTALVCGKGFRFMEKVNNPAEYEHLLIEKKSQKRKHASL